MTDNEIKYIEQVIERSKDRRRSFFGMRKTSKAEAAEMVLLAYAPAMLDEIKRMRANAPH